MPERVPSDPNKTTHPLAWVVKMVQDDWRSRTVQKPTIEAKNKVEEPRVEEEDYVLIYVVPGGSHKRLGLRHRTDRLSIAFDVRAQSDVTAWAIKEEVIRIIEFNSLRPDPWGEWDEFIVENEGYPADYPDLTRIVIDAQLVKWARLRPLQRAKGGVNR